MDTWYALVSRVRALFRGRAAERELRDEFEFHVAQETEKHVRAGMSEAEARRVARLTFGSVDAHGEAMHDRRSFRWIEDGVADATYALRWLRRSRSFTAVAVLTLGLGIGAATAIFTIVNVVLLRPLPYPESDRLVMIYAQRDEGRQAFSNISYPDYLSWKQDVKSFERLGLFQWGSLTITGDATQSERVTSTDVNADMFQLLGVKPLLGRVVLPEEELPGRNKVVVLGYGLWQRRYGGERDALGRTLIVDGEPHTIIGVMPAGFQFPYSAELWRALSPSDGYLGRGNRFLAGAVGRLHAGVTHEEAEAELARVSEAMQHAYPDTNQDWEGQYVRLRADLFGGLTGAMLIVFGAAGLVLIIVCGNVANLLLARGAVRAREMALRSALGARRTRLLRQLLTESLVLTALGGVVGIVIAYWGMIMLRGFLVNRLPAFIQVTPDLRVYGFAVGITALVALLAGILPAVRGMRIDAQSVVKDGGRSTIGPHGAHVRGALVVAEVALAVVLLIGSGLLIKTMNALTGIDTGFETRNVLTARYSLSPARYDTPERRAVFRDLLLERLRAQPGVELVGTVQGAPFSGYNVQRGYEVEGEPPPRPEEFRVIHFQSVTPEFFRVLDVPLKQGRMIDATDGAGSLPVAVVNESFVARHFAEGSPIGKRIRFRCNDCAWITIVGVIADFRHFQLTQPMRPALYRPYAQDPSGINTLVIRTAESPEAMTPVLRRVLAEVDPDVPAFRIEALADVVARQTWVQRIARDILAAFAVTAALLCVIGLWGVISYSVERQRHELGIRLALGEAPMRVLRLVLRQGLGLAVLGVAIGTGTALYASTALRRLLFQVEPVDTGTFIVVPLAVASIAAIATLIPARRAASTDPMIALRNE
jgi:putative ABC transport system permease protein